MTWPVNMQPVSLWHLVWSSPEWVAVFANALFAAVTIGVIIWQVRVMIWQGHVSERHERMQNRLIQLQHEHEWVFRLNEERAQLLKLASKLHLAASCLKETESAGDPANWEELQGAAYELDSRLRILDVAAWTGANDAWHANLEGYVEAVLQAVIDDFDFNRKFGLTTNSPNPSTRKALKDAEQRFEIIKVFLALEGAIRMEFLDFKNKWDASLWT